VAHKKGQGSSRNGRDSNPKMLGIKLFGGQRANAGSILCRQRGTRWKAGLNAYYGRDWTIHARVEGTVYFDRDCSRINVMPLGSEEMGPVASGAALMELRTPSRSRFRPIHSLSDKEGFPRTSPDRPLVPDVHNSEIPEVVGGFLDRLFRQKGDAVPHHMKDFEIRADRTRPVSDPAFGARVSNEGEALLVPPIVAEVLEQFGVVTASGFLSCARVFPSAIADGLSWEAERVDRARGDLVDMLKHSDIDPSLLLEGDSSDGFGFGALLPDD
jgi:large subunit ribosomal protein L27